MSKELEELKKSIANNPTMKKWAKQTAEAQKTIADKYSLLNIYPNPFNPVTSVNFTLPIESEISLEVYNLQGRMVELLASGNMQPGQHSITWNADSHSSGVYFVKMIAGDYVDTQKLILLK